MRISQLIGAISLGAFLLLGCDGENITEVSQKETDISLGERVGPVSQYGELLAGQVDGVGRIYGSCNGITAGKEVQVRGMSMFWSVAGVGAVFYNEAAIDAMVRDMKIEIIRLRSWKYSFSSTSSTTTTLPSQGATTTLFVALPNKRMGQRKKFTTIP